jgi:hypothetical protein
MRRKRGIWFLGMALAVLAGAPAAEAGTLAKVNGEYTYTEPDGDTDNNLVVLYYCGTPGFECTEPGLYFLIRDHADPISPAADDCDPYTPDPTFLKCTDTSVTAWRLSLSAGNDQVFVQAPGSAFPVPLRVDGGAGSDQLNGGPQGDSLMGGPGNDTLNGAEGDDLLEGGLDSDVLNGYTGTDTTTYANHSLGVTVDLGVPGSDDGSSEDGPAGSRDNNDSIENVIGGAGADELRGTSAANVLDGRDGDDTLNALAGQDTVLGGSGVDNVQARDGEPDSVDCGPDEDGATTDAVDTRVNCDPVAPVAPSGGGGTTVVTNTVTLPSRAALDLAFSFSAGRRSTTLRELFATVEPGARLTVSCRTARGKRCARVRDFARATASGSVRLRAFERRPLPVGARIELRLTKDGMTGAVKVLTVRRRKAPSVRTLCLPQGASRPAAC